MRCAWSTASAAATELVDISPMVDADARADHRRTTRPLNVRRGNVMARQRMIVLYDRSADLRRAWSSARATRPRRCSATGRCAATWPARFSPIGDLYKSQLRDGGRELGVPEEILAKPPSADLWPGQTDEDELGASYDALDRTLFALVDRRWTGRPMRRRGPRRALVEWVARRVARHGVQTSAAAGREALPAHAGHRPPLPAAASRLALRAVTAARSSSSPRRSAISVT